MKFSNMQHHATLSSSVLIVFLCTLGFPGTALAAEALDPHNSEKDVPAVEGKAWHTRGVFLERMGVIEENLGVFFGNAQLAGAQVTATYQCLFCGMSSGSQNFQFEKSNVAGIRWGMWGENFGTALELSTTHAASMKNPNGGSLSAGYTSISVIPMLRFPFFKADSMPGGHLNLYGGVGLSFGLLDNIEVSIPGLPPFSGSNQNRTPGNIALIGASLRYSSLILFVERRSIDSSLTYDGSVNNFSLSPVSTTSVPFNMNATVMGVEYRY